MISDSCVSCGKCKKACPAGAIRAGEGKYEIDSEKCIDCGTCAAVCPKGAASPVPGIRESISIRDLAENRCYFSPGCALSLYKPELPDHTGLTVSVHDSCGYRHRPQVHRAVRSLLRKMNIEIVESAFSETRSVCCGDNFYGLVPNKQVKERIQMRADLLFSRQTEQMPDSLDEYHSKLTEHINNCCRAPLF